MNKKLAISLCNSFNCMLVGQKADYIIKAVKELKSNRWDILVPKSKTQLFKGYIKSIVKMDNETNEEYLEDNEDKVYFTFGDMTDYFSQNNSSTYCIDVNSMVSYKKENPNDSN